MKVKQLTFSYKENLLYQNVSFNIDTGKIIGLLGKNGAGKSTLLKLLTGHLFPNDGEILLNEFNVSDRNPNFLSAIYYIPEEFDLPNCNIATYLKLHAPYYPNFSEEKLNKCLEEMEIDKTMKIKNMSYGTKKKFLVAFALATGCTLLVMDEPTNGLDIPSKRIFKNIVAANLSENQTLIISTHQVKDIENLIDHLMVVDKGKLLLSASLTDIESKLLFRTSPEKPNEAIYSEECLEGYNSIISNSEATDSLINIELLFSALTNKEKTVNHILN